MRSFLSSLAGLVFGALSGYDRLMFRGHHRSLCRPGGMAHYCHTNGVLYKDFKAHALERTERLIKASQAEAVRLGRPIRYLPSSRTRKEDVARGIAQCDGVTDGLIAVLRCTEPCRTFVPRGDRASGRLVFRAEQRQCLHLYHYYQHPVFGFCYARLQTWFPFTVQVGINGREWLARQLDREGLAYLRRDNCVTWVEDLARAQAFLDEQVRTDWSAALGEVRARVHPAHPELLGAWSSDYYWSLSQSEWATDVLFKDRAELGRRYGPWVRFAMNTFGSVDILRFLGRKLPATGTVGNLAQEVVSDLRGVLPRQDGLRVKHRVGSNSIKMYDKAGGQVLRVETTVHDPSDFKVYRPKEGDPEGSKDWRQLRSGVADVQRRAAVNQAANERYLGALAAAGRAEPLKEVAGGLTRRVREPGAKGRRLRGLNPLSEADAALLEAVGRPEHMVSGFRNRDVAAILLPRKAVDAAERKRRSAWVTRQLRLLRGHGLIKKVPKSHRYQVTDKGREALTAVLAARNASTAKLIELAA